MSDTDQTEPSITIKASAPDSVLLLKSMISGARYRKDYSEVELLIDLRRRFEEWIDADRLQRVVALT